MASHPVITAVFLSKGGTGKSTSATLVAGEAASRGLRVLLVDLDEQCNASMLVDPEIPESGEFLTVLDMVSNAAAGHIGCASLIALPTAWTRQPRIAAAGGRLDVVVGDAQFKDAAVAEYGFEALRDALTDMSTPYDVVVLDCPPSSGLTVQSALAAAHQVLLVTESQHLSVVGLKQSLEFVDEFNVTAAGMAVTPVDVRGVVITKFKPQIEQIAAAQEIRAAVPGKVLEPVIPERAVVQRAMAAHVPVSEFPGSAAQEITAAYRQITDSVLQPRETVIEESA